MGSIDQFIYAQIAPQLWPGEQVLSTGFVRSPTKINYLGVVGHYEKSWNVAATNLRLVLMLCDTTGILEATPQPVCREIVTWWYQELREVTLGRCVNSSGIFFGLVPHEPLGPHSGKGARYDVFPQVSNVDGQPQFFTQFAPWLEQQVRARAFPMDGERQARIQQHAAAKQHEQAATAQRQAEAAQQRREMVERTAQAVGQAASATKPWLLPVFGGLVVLVLLAGGAVGIVDALEAQSRHAGAEKRLSATLEVLESNLERAKSGKEPPKGCPEKDLADERYASYCHGCFVSEIVQSGAARVYQRGGKVWSCPEVSEYEHRVADVERKRSDLQDSVGSARIQLFAGAGGSGLGVLVGVALAIVLVRRRARS